MVQWRQVIRDLHEESWGFDWATHLAELNARLELAGPDAFGLPPGLPPAWVVGDLDALAAGEWVLVVSLNQARREDDEGWQIVRLAAETIAQPGTHARMPGDRVPGVDENLRRCVIELVGVD